MVVVEYSRDAKEAQAQILLPLRTRRSANLTDALKIYHGGH